MTAQPRDDDLPWSVRPLPPPDREGVFFVPCTDDTIARDLDALSRLLARIAARQVRDAARDMPCAR